MKRLASCTAELECWNVMISSMTRLLKLVVQERERIDFNDNRMPLAHLIGCTVNLNRPPSPNVNRRTTNRWLGQTLCRNRRLRDFVIAEDDRDNCPQNGRSAGAEASGRSGSGPTSRNSVVESIPRPEEFSEEQLENLLAQRRLEHEQSLLTEDCSSTNSVTASEKSYQTVGSTVYIDLLMDGEPVRAMVDMSAQSTIISRSTLHVIGQRAKVARRPLPMLEVQSVQLYGKDGKTGGR